MENFRLIEQPPNTVLKIWKFAQKFQNIKGKELAGVHLSINKIFFLDHPNRLVTLIFAVWLSGLRNISGCYTYSLLYTGNGGNYIFLYNQIL